VVVDNLTSMTRTVIITATIIGLLILLFTDRYLVAMLVKPLDRIRQQFRQIAQGDLSQPIEPFGRNCVGQLVPLLSAMQDSLREAVSTIRSGSENIWRGATEISSGNNDLFPYRRAGCRAGRDGSQHGTADCHGETECGKRASGQPTGRCGIDHRQPWRLAGGRSGDHHERYFGKLEENC
jgi:HAMP domain-containing protein